MPSQIVEFIHVGQGYYDAFGFGFERLQLGKQLCSWRVLLAKALLDTA